MKVKNVRITDFLCKMICALLLTNLIPLQSASAAACSTPTETTVIEGGITYSVRTFTTVSTNCTWSIPAGVTNIQLLIVGGGGGAGFGSCGGGGGAGRVMISNSNLNVTPGSSISITIGDGGIGGFWGGSGSTDWRLGLNGETTSVTVAAQTYSASGGGGGGGGGGANGNSGGSGGGGAACGVTGTGGGSDNSSISGFTTYANAGRNGSGSGGGGGGGGGAATNQNGGNGVTVWGVTIAGGGGGWSGGTGGTGGGGTATNSFSTKAASGSQGTDGTGSGGGGGNDGGSGRVAIRFSADTTTPTFTSSSSFSAAENIATSANAATIKVSESATVTISSGVDAGLFNIVTSDTVTAFIRFKASPNFEVPSDNGGNNVYDLVLTATDPASNAGTQTITIAVTDVVDTSSFNSFALSGSASYRTVVTITANVSVASRVSFRAKNVIIAGCKNKLTSGSSPNIVATCSWRPSNRGAVTLTATASPTGAGISSTSATPISVMVGNRSGNR